MIWIFLGYASMIYSSFVLLAIRELPMHPNPMDGAMSMLFMLPALVIGFGAEVFVHGTEEQRQAVRDAFARRLLPRTHAFAAGACAGAVVVGVGCTLYWTKGLGTGSLLLAFVVGFLTLVISPAFACAWIIERAKDLLESHQGFEVVQTDQSGTDDAR